MPRKLRSLSSDEVVAILERFGFRVSFGKGSHCKLSRMKDGGKQVVVVSRHAVIAKGTLKSIYRKAVPYIGEEGLDNLFYTDYRRHFLVPPLTYKGHLCKLAKMPFVG